MKYLLLYLLILLTSCNVFETLGEKTDVDPNFFRGNNERIEGDDNDNVSINEDNTGIVNDNTETTELREPSYLNLLDINIELDTSLPARSQYRITIKNISSSELTIFTSFNLNEGNIYPVLNWCIESILASNSSCYIDLETYDATLNNPDIMTIEFSSPIIGLKTEIFNIKVSDPIIQ